MSHQSLLVLVQEYWPLVVELGTRELVASLSQEMEEWIPDGSQVPG